MKQVLLWLLVPVAVLLLSFLGLAPALLACGLLGVAIPAPRIQLRGYQMPVFNDMESKVLVVDWSRQIGKSFTMANWAVRRILTQLAKPETSEWLVVVLSNSKDNGQEFAMKAAEVCRKMGQAVVQEFPEDLDTVKFEDMKFQIRITVGGKLGRILVLAASPRTARGFSGDLILDEFAFHEDDRAIWEAAEPIISANPDFLCRICSTRNGTKKLFHGFATNGEFPVNRVRRSDAWAAGEIKIASLKRPGTLLTPAEAEAEAVDRKAYRQNYECESSDELGSVLSWEAIQAAEHQLPFAIDEQAWTQATLARLYRLPGSQELFAGCDVARVGDFTCVVVYAIGPDKRRHVVAILKMRGMRLPAQQAQIDRIMDFPNMVRIAYDATGLGLGLYEYAQEKHGAKVMGINFSTRVPIEARPELLTDGRRAVTAAITEIMALDLSTLFDDGMISIPYDRWLREDLRKPERVTTATGRVTIAATRDAAGHADGFWAMALAEHAHRSAPADSWTAQDAEDTILGGQSISPVPFIRFHQSAQICPQRPAEAPRPLSRFAGGVATALRERLRAIKRLPCFILPAPLRQTARFPLLSA